MPLPRSEKERKKTYLRLLTYFLVSCLKMNKKMTMLQPTRVSEEEAALRRLSCLVDTIGVGQ